MKLYANKWILRVFLDNIDNSLSVIVRSRIIINEKMNCVSFFFFQIKLSRNFSLRLMRHEAFETLSFGNAKRSFYRCYTMSISCNSWWRSLTREATAQSNNNFVDNSFLEYVPTFFYVLRLFIIIEAWCAIIKYPPMYICVLFVLWKFPTRRGGKRERKRCEKKCFSVCTKGARVTSRERNSRRDDVCLTNLHLGKEGNVPGGMPWNADWYPR